MSDSEISVKIGADSSDFEAGAESAGEASDGLAGKLRDLKSEGTSAGRTARFFAADLAEIIPGADGAAGSLQKLIQIGLEGFSIGGALTAAALAASTLKSAFEADAQAAAELRRS